MNLIGNKVKKYVVITCPVCNNSFRINWKDILESNVNTDIVCPWCESSSPSFELLDKHEIEFQVVVDE